jgi:SSS family transporter
LPTNRLSPIDLALVAAYLIAITLFGLRFRKKGKESSTLKSYFLADNTIPWWAIALSIVSAETSTLTIVSIPGVAFAGNMGFLQIVLGYMLGRIVVAMLFLPKYFRGEMLTAYQLIDRRFGHVLHKVTAGLFLLTRAAAEGVRVFAISIVVSIAIGTGDTLSIAIISALTLLYTFEGGMAAVIWTDVVQMALYIAGTLVALWSIAHQTPGGWTHIHAVAAPLGKFHMLNFAFNLTTTYTFWAGILGGTFLTMASHGTDQLMVQRLLAARNLRESRLALLSSGLVIFMQFTLFLLIGIGLFVFYSASPTHFRTNDYIFPTYIVQQMPHGIAGLLVAAILAAAMSNLSAALNSLASTTVIDFYMPIGSWYKNRRHSGRSPESPYLSSSEPTPPSNNALVSRLATVFWALILFAIAVYSIQHGGKGHVVETGLSIASVAYGCLLGVFLLGTLTRYATQWGTISGMLCGFALNLYLWKETTIAFTWYVLIGSLATFALGLLFSLILPKPRRAIAAAIILCLSLLSFRSEAQESAWSSSMTSVALPPCSPCSSFAVAAPAPDFSPITTLITEAIAKHQLPGAVVLIGHNGKVVFEKAYGNRALEPTIEPMTEDTIFDMASLTKVLVTTTAVLQLYEQHKLDLDAPVAKYLPEFAASPTCAPDSIKRSREPLKTAAICASMAPLEPDAGLTRYKSQITIRELMTHYSGLPEDVSLKDDWGLKSPDKAEGIRRAMASVPYGPPGQTFKYSDINFITLGYLVEKVSGRRLEDYADEHVFQPLAMKETGFRPVGTCNQYQQVLPIAGMCADRAFMRVAPTAHDDESKADPGMNPRFDTLLRGVVHDPTTRRMGGVAGHAGVFSTAADVSKFCQALLDKLLDNTGPFPLSQATLKLATAPQAPSTAHADATIFTADGQPTKGVAQRGLGWDINSGFSRPRGEIFPISTREHPGSFGHTGFTGTSIWIDPTSDTYVILLSNAIHPRGAPPISTLRGQVATAAAEALMKAELKAGYRKMIENYVPGSFSQADMEAIPRAPFIAPSAMSGASSEPPHDDHLDPEMLESGISRPSYPPSPPSVQPPCAPCSSLSSPTQPQTLTGIDVLESTHFAALKALAQRHNGHLKLAVLANQSSIDAQSRRTIDILKNADPAITLEQIFTPEHGLFAAQDTEHLLSEQDPATHLPVISLYGPKPSDKHPKQSDLKNVDAVIIDLPDAGVRFWTYETVLGYFLEDCAKTKVEVVVLDRPNPIGGGPARGPISDPGAESYIDFMPLPVRHGMTVGELARYFNDNASISHSALDPNDSESMRMGGGAGASATGSNITPPATLAGLHARLTVIPMQNWSRSQYFADTGLPWVPPSPNMKTPATNIVYPGVALIETTNMSVGRGTPAPYENFGAAFVNAPELAGYLNARKIPGATFTATTLTIAETPEKYPFHGQTIPAIHIDITDRNALDTPEMGVEILSALHRLYPTQFQLEKARTILLNAATLEAIKAGKDPCDIAATWSRSLAAFNAQRHQFLLYR